MAAWRAARGVDALMTDFEFTERGAVRRAYPHFYHKTDRHGRPVYYELLGRADLGALLALTTSERYMAYHIQCCESLRCGARVCVFGVCCVVLWVCVLRVCMFWWPARGRVCAVPCGACCARARSRAKRKRKTPKPQTHHAPLRPKKTHKPGRTSCRRAARRPARRS